MGVGRKLHFVCVEIHIFLGELDKRVIFEGYS